jgi:16S rRNA (guanine527-N7)-methyltransferase
MKFDFDELRRWADGAGIVLGNELLNQLRVYVSTLLQWNRRVNLVSQSDPATILVKHIADSLMPSTLCHEHERVADLGSGAGLPGIPMAIARPDIDVTLVESNRRRVSFLTEAVRSTGLRRVHVVEARMASAAERPDLRGAFTLVIARALASLEDLLQHASPFLAPRGRAVAMKGPRHERELAASAALRRFPLERVVLYKLPDGAERALVVFRVSRETFGC